MGAYDKLSERYSRSVSQGWYCCPPPDEGGDDDKELDDNQLNLDNELDDDDRKILDSDDDDTSDGAGGGEGDGDGSGDGNDADADAGSDDDFDYKAGYEQVMAKIQEMESRDATDTGSGKDKAGGGGDGPVKSGDLVVAEYPADNPLSKYNGMKFSAVYAANPNDAYAIDMHHAQQHALDLRDAQNAEAAEKSKHDDWVKQELSGFSDKRAAELYDGKKYSELNTAEQASVTSLQGKVLDWMKETGRGGDSIEDAYFLMEKDNIISRAKESGASDLADKARKGASVRVQAGGGNGSGDKVDGTWKSLLSASASQVEDHIDGLSGAALDKFLKDAPKAFRKKYPALPYD